MNMEQYCLQAYLQLNNAVLAKLLKGDWLAKRKKDIAKRHKTDKKRAWIKELQLKLNESLKK